jgi:hypothetical protein
MEIRETNLEKERRNINISLIQKFNCTNLYFDLFECVEKKGGNENTCRQEFNKIGECVRTGMKNEEMTKLN